MFTRVTGWLLIISPIFAMAMWIAVWPVNLNDSVAKQISDLTSNQTLAIIGGIGGLLGMLSWWIAHTFLARSMQNRDSVSGILSEISGILSISLIPLMMFNMSTALAIFEPTSGTTAGAKYLNDPALAEAIFVNGEGTGFLIGPIWALAFLFISISIVLQNKFHPNIASIVIGGVGGVVAIAWFLMAVIPSIDDGPAWMLMALLTVIMGIFTLNTKEQ